MNNESTIVNLLHVIAVFLILYSFYKNHQMTVSKIVVFFLSIFASILIILFSLFFKNILSCGLFIFFLFVISIAILKFKDKKQIIYYSSFVTTLIFYIYSIIRILSKTKIPNINYLILTDYIFAICLSAVFLVILVVSLNLRFLLPANGIGVFIMFFSVSIFVLELILFSFLQTVFSSVNYNITK